MVQEAAQYAEEDEMQHQRVGSLNIFEQYMATLRTQLDDEEGLGGKVSNTNLTSPSKSLASGLGE